MLAKTGIMQQLLESWADTNFSCSLSLEGKSPRAAIEKEAGPFRMTAKHLQILRLYCVLVVDESLATLLSFFM